MDSGKTGADFRSDTKHKDGLRTLWVVLPSAFALFAFLFVLDRHIDRRFAEVSVAFSTVEMHVEKATTIRRDARKAYVLMLESWLLSDTARDSRQLGAIAAIDHVRQESAEFAALAPIDAPEEPLMARLTDHLSTFSKSVLASSGAGEGPEGAPELEQAMTLVDSDVSAILGQSTRASEEARDEMNGLRRQRDWLEGIILVTAVVAIGATILWLQRMRAEARIAEYRRQQERVVQLQSQFFASVSHELRTPLVAIRGFVSDIEEHPNADEMIRERSRRIHQEAMSLLGMINNILDAAKIEAGQTQLLFEDIALDGVLGRCVTRCQGLLRDKPVTLELEMPSNTPLVRADFVKLQQVFTNLIANAIKFTEKGCVHVRVRFGEGAFADKLVVDVEDTGIGIAQETLPLIWKPFQQADASVSRQYGGTGLGLSIARGIVQLHGGSIDVRSTPGVGSTFTVLLPVGQPAGIAP